MYILSMSDTYKTQYLNRLMSGQVRMFNVHIQSKLL